MAKTNILGLALTLILLFSFTSYAEESWIWEEIATDGSPGGRSGAKMLLNPVDNLLYLTTGNGFGGGPPYQDTFVLDLTTNTWQRLTDPWVS